MRNCLHVCGSPQVYERMLAYADERKKEREEAEAAAASDAGDAGPSGSSSSA